MLRYIQIPVDINICSDTHDFIFHLFYSCVQESCMEWSKKERQKKDDSPENEIAKTQIFSMVEMVPYMKALD